MFRREAHVADYNLTAAGLGFGDMWAAAEKPARGRGSAVKPKYRDPASGKTWSGRGMMPLWMAVLECFTWLD